MPKSLIELAGSVTSDALTLLLGIPTATLQTAFGQHLADRLNEAGAILREEIRAGNVDVATAAGENDGIGIVYSYMLAARNGAARRNLRMLAKVIVGQARRDRLYADEFNRYAEMLSRLSRDEIVVVGRYFALVQEELANRDDNDSEHARSDAWNRLVDEMVPGEFPDRSHVENVCTLAMGHGLVLAISAYGGLAYAPSPLMREISELVDFQEVLRTEGEAVGG